MEKKRKKTERERIEEIELAAKSRSELLLERMAYHRRIAEERARRERPLWRRLLPG